MPLSFTRIWMRFQPWSGAARPPWPATTAGPPPGGSGVPRSVFPRSATGGDGGSGVAARASRHAGAVFPSAPALKLGR